MRVGGNNRGLVVVSLPFSFPIFVFPICYWLYTPCIPFGSLWAILFLFQ